MSTSAGSYRKVSVETSPLIKRLSSTGLVPLLQSVSFPVEIELPDGSVLVVGNPTEQPLVRVTFRTLESLRTPMTELGVAEAYMRGDIDLEGDFSVLFDLRSHLRDPPVLRQRLQFLWDHVRSTVQMNTDSINQHYHRGDDFYLTFIDRRYRFYSHGLFHSLSEAIEEASEHKLESMFQSLGLKPGMRLLDIGGGWGGVTQYCCARGVHVTTLTIARDSAKYIRRLIAQHNLSGEVLLQDFLLHTPAEPYDHAVIYGVIEHIPDYRRFAAKVWDVLKPGGRLYLDASAAVERHYIGSFTRKYIWPGTHMMMTVQDVVAELLYHGMDIVEVKRETRDYELTMLEWAKRLDAAKDKIVQGWGEETYRMYRLYLWGGTHCFKTGTL